MENENIKVLYGDTDSLFVNYLNEDEDPVAFGKNLAEQLNKYWNERLLNEFELNSYLEIEFENIIQSLF